MRIWISVAVAFLAVLPPVAGAAAGSCPPNASRTCLASSSLVDLTAVPDISRQIVDREPAGQPRRRQAAAAQPADGYTGPTVGISRMGRAPTVGYHWSLH